MQINGTSMKRVMSLAAMIAVMAGTAAANAQEGDDRMQGFAPPAGGAFQLRAEAIAGEPGDPVLAGNFVYADELGSVFPGQGRQVSVHTATGTTATWTSASSLQPLLHGEVRSDGGIEAYDPDFGSLTVRWPDGRSRSSTSASASWATRARTTSGRTGPRPSRPSGHAASS